MNSCWFSAVVPGLEKSCDALILEEKMPLYQYVLTSEDDPANPVKFITDIHYINEEFNRNYVTVQRTEFLSDLRVSFMNARRVNRFKGITEEYISRRSHGKNEVAIVLKNEITGEVKISSELYSIDEACAKLKNLIGMTFAQAIRYLKIRDQSEIFEPVPPVSTD